MISHKTNKDCISLVKTWCIANYNDKVDLIVVKRKPNNQVQFEIEIYNNNNISYNTVINKSIEELKNEIYSKVEKLVC